MAAVFEHKTDLVILSTQHQKYIGGVGAPVTAEYEVAETHRDTPVIIVFFVQVSSPNHLVIRRLVIFDGEGFFYFFVIVNMIISIGVLLSDHISSPDQSIFHQTINDTTVQFCDFSSIEQGMLRWAGT